MYGPDRFLTLDQGETSVITTEAQIRKDRIMATTTGTATTETIGIIEINGETNINIEGEHVATGAQAEAEEVEAGYKMADTIQGTTPDTKLDMKPDKTRHITT